MSTRRLARSRQVAVLWTGWLLLRSTTYDSFWVLQGMRWLQGKLPGAEAFEISPKGSVEPLRFRPHFGPSPAPLRADVRVIARGAAPLLSLSGGLCRCRWPLGLASQVGEAPSFELRPVAEQWQNLSASHASRRRHLATSQPAAEDQSQHQREQHTRNDRQREDIVLGGVGSEHGIGGCYQ